MSGAKRPVDKDPWCCAGDKLRINVSGFDAGWLNAMKSVRHLVRALDKEQALEVIDELIAGYTSPLARCSAVEAKQKATK